ncbi:hypothetical protein AB0G49_11765 [Streptomyces longwoodensis]|uniref:hypothetical protein n=1 Tax=Streptomyces longwoodensis TaxID=68231 RepID=UPI0033EFBAA0
MTGVHRVDALWAWYGKESGSAHDYRVLHNSGGSARRDQLARFVQSASAGNPPPPDVRGGDGLPWITVNSWTIGSDSWIGVAVTDRSDRRDRDGRAVVPTSFFLVDYDDLRPYTPGFLALYRAVEHERLADDPSRTTSVPLHVTQGDEGSAHAGLERIAQFLPGGDGLRGAAHWAAQVAARLLAGRRVVLTGASHLDRYERLMVLDAIAGMLPYGLRADLSVATCGDGFSQPQHLLSFGPGHTPGADLITLGGPAEQPLDGQAALFANRLDRLIEARRGGVDTLLTFFAGATAPLLRDDREAVSASLDELDVVHLAAVAVRDGRATPQQIAGALDARHPGEAVTDDWADIFAAALTWQWPDHPATGADGTEVDAYRLIGRALAPHWADAEAAGHLQSAAAQFLIAPPRTGTAMDGSGVGMPDSRPGTWATLTAADAAATVLRALLARYEADVAAGAPQASVLLDLLVALGPDAVGAAGSEVATVLSGAPALTEPLLYAEAAAAGRLEAWLYALYPAGAEPPPWLRAWGVLLPTGPRAAGPALALPSGAPDDLAATVCGPGPDGALGVGSGPGQAPWVPELDGPRARVVAAAAVRAGAPWMLANVVDLGWPGLLAAARGAGEQDGLPPADAPGGFPGGTGWPQPPAMPALLAESAAWQERPAHADLLRVAAGAPVHGPRPDGGWDAYEQDVERLYRAPAPTGELVVLVGELASRMLSDHTDPQQLRRFLPVLMGAPAGHGRERTADLVLEAMQTVRRRALEQIEEEARSAEHRVEEARRHAAAQVRQAHDEAADTVRDVRARAAEDLRQAHADAARRVEDERRAGDERVAQAETNASRAQRQLTAQHESALMRQAASTAKREAEWNAERAELRRRLKNARAWSARDGGPQDSAAGGPGRAEAEDHPTSLASRSQHRQPPTSHEAALDHLARLARQNGPVDEVVRTWAPLVGTPWDLEALAHAGEWWRHNKGPLFARLEKTLSAQYQNPDEAHLQVEYLRRRVITGRGRTATGAGWEAKAFLRYERFVYKCARCHYRRLWRAYWLGRLRIAERADRHSRRGRRSAGSRWRHRLR